MVEDNRTLYFKQIVAITKYQNEIAENDERALISLNFQTKIKQLGKLLPGGYQQRLVELPEMSRVCSV